MPLWRRLTGSYSGNQNRERAVRKRLAEAGLQPRRRDPAAWLDEDPASARLRTALEDLGPLFAAFGSYLSSRPDLLPLQDCLELVKTNAPAPPTPTPLIRESIRAEGTGALVELASLLEDIPLRHDLFFQWHQATLPQGDRVNVKVLRPELEQRATKDIDLLAILKEAELIGQDGKAVDMTVAVKDFITSLERRMDLENEANALAKLGGELEEDDDRLVPKLYRELSTPKVLTTELSTGKPIAELYPPDEIAEEAEDTISRCQPNAELARCISLAWLKQTLLEDLCWEGSIEENLLFLPGDRIAVTGGQFTRLEEDARSNLLEYLTAVSREEPERACHLLLRETLSDVTLKSRDRLCQQFRQGEPFRFGSWSDAYAGRRLADTLFVQWRLAHQAGFRPPSYLTAFYRGFFGIELVARRLDRHRDAFGEGLDDLRIISATVRLRELLGPSRLKANLERFLPAMEELLQRANQASLLLQDGKLRTRDPSGGRSLSPSSWTFVAGLLALLVSLVVISNRLISVRLDTHWVEGFAALGFVAMAAILLKNVHRGQGG